MLMWTRCLPLLMLLSLTGCAKVDLYSQLEEQEANEMMAILLEDKIDCVKVAGDEERWNLQVSQDDFAKAVMKLREQGYPKQTFVGIGDMFQKSGLVSSPTEERIRFMYALSQELSKTIAEIDGVLSARVHIVLPNNNPFGDVVQPSSASVFVRHRPGIDLTTQIPNITRMVVGSIEGLEYDKVSTVLFAADEVQVPVAPEEAETALISTVIKAGEVPVEWVVMGSLAGLTVLASLSSMYVVRKGRAKQEKVKKEESLQGRINRPMTA